MYYNPPTEKDLEITEQWLHGNVDNQTLQSVENIAPQIKNTAEDAHRTFQISQGLIRKIAARYLHLDTAVNIDDLVNQAFFGVRTALQKYDMTQCGNVKFSTILTWYVQKCFQELCPPAFMAAEVVTPDGERKILHYNEFQKVKRHLPVKLTSPDGQDVRYVPLSEFKTAEDSLPIGTKVKPSEFNVISTIRSLDYTSSTDEDAGNLLDTGRISNGEEWWDEEEEKLIKAIDRKRREEKKKKANGKL